MSVNKLVTKALKRIGNVHPVVKQGAEEVIRRADKKGIYVLFSDGYRSNAEQNELYAQGRTKPGNIVTNARGGQSYHNFGLALDMYITNKEGTTASWPTDKLTQVAKIAKSLGFEWGGDWTSFRDVPHIQMTGGLSLAQLRAGKKPNISLKGDNASSTSDNPSNTSGKYTEDAKYPKLYNKGTNVGKWQHKLKNLGYYTGEIDNSFGPATDKATKAFQKANGLAVDGQAGPASNKKADELLNGKSSKNEIAEDGWLGPATAEKAQEIYGMDIVDGKVSGQPDNASTRNIPSVTLGNTGSNLVREMQKEFDVPKKWWDGKIGSKNNPKSTLISKMQHYYKTPRDQQLSGPSMVIKEWQKALNKGKRK